MNIVEQIKDHSLYALAVLLIPIIGGVWYLSETLRVNPKKEQIEWLEKQVTPLKEQVAELKEQVAALSQKNKELNDLVAKLAPKEQKIPGNPEVPESPVEETKDFPFAQSTSHILNFKLPIEMSTQPQPLQDGFLHS
jgi:Tfp pilus assembly protein PilO